MHIDELRDEIRKILPGAQFEFDNYGQIIIYTDKSLNHNSGEVIVYYPDEEN